MFPLTDIIEATNGKCSFRGRNILFNNISTDTRTIQKGDLFIALSGPNFDGHDFLEAAFKNGAAGLVISNKKDFVKAGTCLPLSILVPDTLKALHDIARCHRKKMKAKIIGVTGSSGKTTTKDMIASVLSQSGPVLKTEENLNNEYGVPLTLLRIERKHKFAVIEMAMQSQGEIKKLAETVLPDIAVITNSGQAHLKQLGSEKNIAKAKSEIFCRLKKNSFAVLNADDKFFGLMKANVRNGKLITFGIKNKADIAARDIKEDRNNIIFEISAGNKKTDIILPLPGTHNIYNALSAAAVGYCAGLSGKQVRKGLSRFRLSSKRMEIIDHPAGFRIINDTYNANPSSMRAAVSVLASQRTGTKGKRIAVVGDMLELGESSSRFHGEIGKFIADSNIEIVISIGKESKKIHDEAAKGGSKSYHFKNNAAAAKKLLKTVGPSDIVLFKASRGMKFEEICQIILDNVI